MKFAFIDGEKAAFSIALCRVLGVSRAGFHAWRTRPPSARQRANDELAGEIKLVHAESRGTYGSPRVRAELRHRGRRVGRRRVARLMREQGLYARRRRRFRHTTDSKHAFPIEPNVLARNFEADAPNQV